MIAVTPERLDSASHAVSEVRRLVLVADDSLVLRTIHVAFRQSDEFRLVGYARAGKTTARTILSVRPDGILLDAARHSEAVLELIREISSEDDQVTLIVLALDLDSDWLSMAFDAGATTAISKETQPLVLTTLVRETIDGHIVHRAPNIAAATTGRSTGTNAIESPLTTRELEILKLVASGSTNSDIGRRLWVTEQTVKFHLRNIYRKLDVANRTQASHFAHLRGLVGSGPSPVRPGRPHLTLAS